MAIYTQLSFVATPGRRHSFATKIFVDKGEGLFTELSVLSLPGGRHTFLPKGIVVDKGEGLFTELSVLSLPGGRHTFLPKGIVVPVPPVPEEPEIIFDASGGVTGRVQEDLYRWRLRDDKEILDIIMTIVLSGRL